MEGVKSHLRTPYETPAFRSVAGACLRPGGTELTDRAISFCGFREGARLLDVGCGAGATVEHLRLNSGLAAAGVDVSRRLVAEGLVRNPSLPLAEGGAEALPVSEGTLDGVLCECVLSLVASPRRALGEFRRVLRPGGFLILSDLYLRDPLGCFPPAGPAGENPVRGVMAGDMLETLLAASGFRIRLWEDHTRALQELAARLVLAHGSLDGPWGVFGGVECTGRLGYFLLVARRER